MWKEVIFLVVCTYITNSHQQQGSPPGIPPQKEVYPEGHGPPGDITGHHGGFGTGAHDAEHIKEHLKDVVDKPKEEMTDEELEFHYFKLHDYDGNNKLDGTEITKAITHFHGGEEEGANKEETHKHEAKVFSDEEIANIVDMVLKEDDLNLDGYIEYVEFVTAQRKARGDDGGKL